MCECECVCMTLELGSPVGSKVGLRRGDRLSGRVTERCFREPITYALKNFLLTAIIQERLFARKKGDEQQQEARRGVRWWINTRLDGAGSLPQRGNHNVGG